MYLLNEPNSFTVNFCCILIYTLINQLISLRSNCTVLVCYRLTASSGSCAPKNLYKIVIAHDGLGPGRESLQVDIQSAVVFRSWAPPYKSRKNCGKLIVTLVSKYWFSKVSGSVPGMLLLDTMSASSEDCPWSANYHANNSTFRSLSWQACCVSCCVLSQLCSLLPFLFSLLPQVSYHFCDLTHIFISATAAKVS